MTKSLAIRLCAALLGILMAAGVLTACSLFIGGPDVTLTEPATEPPETFEDITSEEVTTEETTDEETTLPETTEEVTTEEVTTEPETTEEVTTEEITTEEVTTSPPAPVIEPWQIVLVNPWYPLPQDHKIELKTVSGKYKLDARCADAAKQMLADCKAAGYTPSVCSAYRTTDDQVYLFEKKVTTYKNKGYSEEKARELAAKETAVPGTSEHQLGLAIDILCASRPWLDEGQAKTPTQQWLMANCHKYGFILRYPKGTTDITGIIYEPWHYRYVGVEVATEIVTKGITLEEYLGMVAGPEDTKLPPPMPEPEPTTAPETTEAPETTVAPETTPEPEQTTQPVPEVLNPISVLYSQSLPSEMTEQNTHIYFVDGAQSGPFLIFTPLEGLKDVRFYLLDNSEAEYELGQLHYTIPEFTAEKDFAAGVVFYGSMTTYGLSFTDPSGNERHFAIGMNSDGSGIFIKEYTPVTPDVTTSPRDENELPFVPAFSASGGSASAEAEEVTEAWNLMLVNQHYFVPEDLKIELVEISGGHTVDARCADALKAMLADCKAAGYTPYVCDGYRTNDEQTYILNQKTDKYLKKGYSEAEARAQALKEAALPGTSEHQIGLAVDILCSSQPWADQTQENTETQKWLMANCHKYGFILRYLKGKSDITGFIYEPWHYRYVGIDAATEIMSRGITLEEYLGKVGAH